MNIARPGNPAVVTTRPPRMKRLLVPVLLALLGVSACGSGQAAAGVPADPLALVGSWSVAGTGQRVRLDPSGFEIVDGCRTLTGTWRADPGGRFLATVDSVVPCPDGSGADTTTPGWPAAARGFAVEAVDRVLRDGAGAELIRLQPAPASRTGQIDPSRPPTEKERAAAGPAAPLPPGAVPAGPAQLVGRWKPADAPGNPFVAFAQDGTWTGSDGCNGTGGTWTAGPDGAFLASTLSLSTLIGCPGTDVADSVRAARTASLDGPALVLRDVTGAELARYNRG